MEKLRNFLRILALSGLILVIVSVWQIQSAAQGLVVTSFPAEQPPITVFAPAGYNPASRPVMLIGHGFAGSQVVMRGFAFTLAHAGYTVVTWDFNGHGSNPRSLKAGSSQDMLVQNAEAALAAAVHSGLVDPRRVVILGHSMGSGAALAYGQKHPETIATIAVSPVGQPVTESLPRNLLLMAGTQEESFLENARARLAEAGGAGGEPGNGTASDLFVVQGANHLTILFADSAHQAARAWLDATFGSQPGAVSYFDRRLLWYLFAVAGSLIVNMSLASEISGRVAFQRNQGQILRQSVGLVLGVLCGTVALWLVGRLGPDLSAIFGLRVGGYLFLWFAAAGGLSLLWMGVRLELPALQALLTGLFAFFTLWLGVGLLGSLVWLPWLLIPARLVLWPLGTLLMLPWFLAVGTVLRGMSWPGQFAAWFLHSALVLGGLLLAMRLSSGLGFLILIMPVFPAVLAFHAAATAPYRGGCAFALSGAMFTSWVVLAVFPLG